MVMGTLIKDASDAGFHFDLIGEDLLVTRPKDVNPPLLSDLKAHKEELIRYLKTQKKLHELIPGGLSRMAFRRRVIDKAGITWHEIPVPLREDVISEYFLIDDVDAAVMELIYLNS